MLINPTENQQKKIFQEKILSMFEQSLTEEQCFLQGVLSGKIKTYSHEEVIADLRKVLKR
ncbi:hypothetical protein [Mannheimia indoligenes]|uniref:hypothetical protein n=1 Tax=Mannheimia indoligenes TaxID=3103145 RepID=UPI002FE5341E